MERAMKKFAIISVAIILALALGLTLCACNKDSYTITFHLNNGTQPIVWKEGDAVPQPARGSDEFLGWFYDEACTDPAYIEDILSFGLKKDLHLYAKWQPANGDEAA